ncbi:MAG: Mobile element protein [uncultured Truepera sp.]|uniref:Mobile element protein n=1 Tax=uncultured Truepera sp. TaxID=543023 RepID=A0A6J4VFM1_9DEIN|nr:MAG: Mobile element protein [uncultured Truepera sp.]
MDKKLTLKYLDQSGFSLMLSLCYTWFRRGSGKQFKVPTRWGSKGRVNLIGTLSLFGEREQLEVRELDGSCNQAQVVAYLETLAKECDPEHLTVVVLDNAPFHKGEMIKEHRAAWEAEGLFLRYLPVYSPQLNLIESVWRKLKGFLMPRRCYDNVNQLREAVSAGLQALDAITI